MGKHQYGLVFDAGSSGTRVYIYQWLNAEAARADDDGEHLMELPKIKTKKDWIKKVKPGVSTFGTKPEKVGPEHLKELVDFALSVVPKKDVAQTPIFLLATAGMRLLPDSQRSAVLENVCSYFQKNTKFQLPDCAMHVQVIPGETEGLYGWVAANYLLGGFDAPDAKHHTKSKNTYGFLDMGGASAQIAFAPNATESEKHWNDLKLLKLRRINGQELDFRVFVTTWLGFGANEARRRYVEKLVESYSAQEHEVPDPCLPRGITAKKNGEEIKPGSADLEGKEAHLIGTGMFPECLKRTYPLLEKEKACADPPCLLDGVHTPNIDFNVNHFVGVSEFWHTTHGVFKDAQKKKAYDFETYQKQVEEFCSQDWKSLEAGVASGKWGVKVDVKEVEEVCFKASWLINVLHMGIGVPRIGLEHMNGTTNKTEALIDSAKDKGFIDAFQAVDKIDGKELSWTLGKIVLYASSQIPPADGAAAVGFGSNVKDNSLPKDFQYAGGAPVLYKPEHDDDDDDDDDFSISLKGHYARRVPGILIFLLILLLAGYLLCGRDRRTALYNKFLTMLGRKPSSGPIRLKRKKAGGNGFGKLFGGAGGSSSPSYDRVLEEATPEDFELADVSSDDGSDRHSASSHSGIEPHSGTAAGVSARSGRASGMNTPANRGMSPDNTRTSPRVGSLTSLGLGNAGGAFERSGLSSRSESRRASPSSRAMGRTPLSAGKESVD